MRRLPAFGRIVKMGLIVTRYALTRQVVVRPGWLYVLSYLNPYSFGNTVLSRGPALRLVLIKLGPLFVKFGQLLSTRPDLLPADIISALATLQDQVPPFDAKRAKHQIEQQLQTSIDAVFSHFESSPMAAASIAQVHAATLRNGDDVIVKVLRPGIEKQIRRDLQVLYTLARWLHLFSRRLQRLELVTMVAEYEQILADEVDLKREAANAAVLRRNFSGSNTLYVPKVYWDYVHSSVLVMERIYGIRISDVGALTQAGTNFKKLAENGVAIFFTQVLRDRFFHADMHPGNIFVDVTTPDAPRYLGVDFGIMGTLTTEDQHYLAANLAAFFNQNYREVATLHVASGWVPPSTRVDQFEAAIRTVAEPIFEKPLKEISFGRLLLELFKTAERFDMKIQPQLMLLQKTLLSVEGLGRQLYPELDLWQTAKPLIEQWAYPRPNLKRLGKMAVHNFPKMIEQLLLLPEHLERWSAQADVVNAPMPEKVEGKSPSRWRPFFTGVVIGGVLVFVLLGLRGGLVQPAYITTHPFIQQKSA